MTKVDKSSQCSKSLKTWHKLLKIPQNVYQEKQYTTRSMFMKTRKYFGRKTRNLKIPLGVLSPSTTDIRIACHNCHHVRNGNLCGWPVCIIYRVEQYLHPRERLANNKHDKPAASLPWNKNKYTKVNLGTCTFYLQSFEVKKPKQKISIIQSCNMRLVVPKIVPGLHVFFKTQCHEEIWQHFKLMLFIYLV